VFNALTPSQLLTGIGRTLRMAADATGALEGYERSQVLSAYSATRLLASEQAAAEQLLVDTRASLLEVLDGDQRPPARRAHEQIAQARDGIAIGFALVDLFKELPAEDATRTSLHGALRDMIDREVAILDAPVA
jgi:hypothetical protein